MSTGYQGSRYTPYGLGFYNPRSAIDAMWHDCPNPYLLSPSTGFGFIDHFLTLNSSWTITEVEAGDNDTTVGIGDGTGGVLVITCDNNENDGAQIQLAGEMFKLGAENHLWFDARVKIGDEATQSDFAVILSTTDTTFIASATSDYVGFVKDDGDTNIDFVTAKNGTETEVAGVATANATDWFLLGFKWDGSALTPYVNGVALSSVKTNIPDDENLSPLLAYLNGAGSAAGDTFQIDLVRCVQINLL